MSVLPILGSDDEMRAALNAGWQRRDLIWERWSEQANEAAVGGDMPRAARLFHRTYWLARFGFSKADPRYATALANLAYVDRATGKTPKAALRLAEARVLWLKVPDGLPEIEVSPRARSSLFHLRMEARHWDTYCDNIRIRLGKFVQEADQSLASMAEGQPPEHRLFSRWRGEKPNVFDDTRKLLAAALLFAGEGRP